MIMKILKFYDFYFDIKDRLLIRPCIFLCWNIQKISYRLCPSFFLLRLIEFNLSIMSHFSFLLGLIEHFLQIMSRHFFPAGLIEDSFIIMSPQQHYMGHTVIFFSICPNRSNLRDISYICSAYVPLSDSAGTFLTFFSAYVPVVRHCQLQICII